MISNTGGAVTGNGSLNERVRRRSPSRRLHGLLIVDRGGARWPVLGPRAPQVYTVDPQVEVLATQGDY
jgi:hypothetical protein